MIQLPAAVLIVLLSAFAAAATGFGFNLVSTPLLDFLYPPRDVVVMTLGLGLVAAGLLLALGDIRRDIEWSVIRPLFLSSLAGMPVGLAFLLWTRSQTLRIVIAALTASFAILMLARVRPRLSGGGRDAVLLGALSGFLSTSTSLNGPPVAFYLLARDFSKDRFRATMVAYVFLATLASLALFAVEGAMTPALIAMVFPLVPPLLLGFAGGLMVVARLTPRGFEKMILVFLLAVGLLGILGSLR